VLILLGRKRASDVPEELQGSRELAEAADRGPPAAQPWPTTFSGWCPSEPECVPSKLDPCTHLHLHCDEHDHQ